MSTNMQQGGDFTTDSLLLLEQWIALPLGIACLAVFVWAAFDGQQAFSVRHLSHFKTTALAAIGWFLTFAVGLLGVALMRFAFYKRSETEPDAKPPARRERVASGGSNRLLSAAAGKWRR